MTGWPLQTGPLAKEKEEEDNIWRRKIFGLWRRRKTRKEMEENICRRKIFGLRGEEKGMKIFEDGKYLVEAGEEE